jgi:hypothetical protein
VNLNIPLSIEEHLYRALLADIEGIDPFVARGLARTAAAKIQRRILTSASNSTSQNESKQTETNHEHI